MTPRKLDFLFFDAGGGHRSAATALKQVIEEQGLAWQIRLVNLQEVLDSLDFLRKVTGVRLEDVYNLLLKKGWTLGTPQLLKVLHAVIRLRHPAQVRLLEAFWRRDPPDLAVSLIPNFNRALHEGLRRGAPGVPMVTILTDLADYPPHLWIEPESQYLICGTERAAGQARALGHDDARIFRTSGMILNPRFYETREVDRERERERLGLKPDLPTGLVLFGGEGSPAMLGIARRLDAAALPLQLIVVCGRNRELAERLRRARFRMPVFIEGFTREVPHYMRLSDFFIGKPGPGSISEALQMKLPVIVERNAWTLPQERYNADWVVEKQVGIALKSFRQIGSAVARLLEPEQYRRFRANAATLENRAVFEIPGILEEILCRKPPG
ncbi:MAG: galactosyldiacylglycerol synthase [Acidobacteria bacterium]|nr:galactosyldiacylglycerol synthase [Acidobacteriota bacterium]